MVVLLYIVFIAGVLPVVLIWGWLRWLRGARPRTLPSMLSLTSFVLATTSGLLAIAAGAYARLVGGLPVRAPSLQHILSCGLLLSLCAVVSALGGAWRSSPLRWHALIGSIGTLLFWVVSATGE
jgi:hypothetical protein